VVSVPAGLDPEADNADSLLLKLPGEILNRIHEFCQETKDMYLYNTKLEARDDDQKGGFGPENRFNGLRSVCRQIRQQFVPLHRRRVEIYVLVLELDQFLAVFRE
jgi:hypothetical protein